MEKDNIFVQEKEIEFEIPEIPEWTDEELKDLYMMLIQDSLGG